MPNQVSDSKAPGGYSEGVQHRPGLSDEIGEIFGAAGEAGKAVAEEVDILGPVTR